MTTVHELPTPCLLLDPVRLERNIERMKRRAVDLGVALRPHMKTAKSIEVARLAAPDGGITVSTLAEAEYFSAHGFEDILYAVGIAPGKFDRVEMLRSRGADLQVVVESAGAARQVAARGIPAWIEIDADGRRAGLEPEDLEVLRIAELLGGSLRGVMTHHGLSYAARTQVARAEAAAEERDAVVEAARRIRSLGIPCPAVSVGSTPTASAATDLSGVTEMRPGVYMFMDLYQAAIGVCDEADIAISVLASVIGHRADGFLIDAGALALSLDRSTSRLPMDLGYGKVCDLDAVPLHDWVVDSVTQEHGVVRSPEGPPPSLPEGAMVRVLPNHACITAACHAEYQVLHDGVEVTDRWGRVGGW
jgi:D-serine deaminase-like pyridoxal phosphate-dependent protein